MRERVGARHWLFLGILSQMPDNAAHVRVMGHLMHSITPGVNTMPTVEVLREKGLITYNPESKLVKLTEAGASRRRQRGRIETPWFLRVPDSFIRLTG